MTLLEWIENKKPGKLLRLDDRIKIEHKDESASILWLNKNVEVPKPLEILEEVFEIYDGIDLFSSTFKIASIDSCKCLGSVEITFSLEELQSEFEFCNPVLPEDSIAFMVRAGIGIYALGLESSTIYEWDTEYRELTGTYKNIFEILDDWLSAFED
ncbi:hypothetical protein DENIS_4446 [Desulfonema ishimotonii]|uniref:SMI1/KNR4 family protein n=1 Tax=Desulfonema ishimotonii TaxID=45657 RepID=A0A401G2H7_9BACT|nr:hypothetical protein [Desulfonema ishimotonii]GBC63452.1 hypothetical protein DENIS_4446 [Desulfonema ishimotonii]